jgi:hypothetical protein
MIVSRRVVPILTRGSRRPSAAVVSSASWDFLLSKVSVRTHMSHSHGITEAPYSHQHETGSRSPIAFGLEAAQATSNIMRLLEASHGGFLPSDAMSSVYHSQALLWRYNGHDKSWKAANPLKDDSSNILPQSSSRVRQPPQLLSLSFSDSRTALANIVAVDGSQRFLSLLRMDAEFLPTPQPGINNLPNDGWFLMRELITQPPYIYHSETKPEGPEEHQSIVSLQSTLQKYFSIEHGGGKTDYEVAQSLFAEEKFNLLAIGSSPHDELASDWSAPLGSVLEISRETYLNGVKSQKPHTDQSKVNDRIISLVLSPCQLAAVVTLQVGNGARTNVFIDHLFLGRPAVDSIHWQILSKVFSPQAWK